jgi:integrase
MLVHRERQASERLLGGSGWQDIGLVFTMPDGAPIERKTLHRDFKRVLRAAALPDLRFHDLRHSAASLLLAEGTHPRVIMELLGHSQIGLTMNTYSHVMPALMRETADTMDAILNREDKANVG